MIHKRRLYIVISLLLIISSYTAAGCSQNPKPNVVPRTKVGQIAIYGRTFLLSVEEVQKGVISLADQGTIPQDEALKSMEIFKKIGESGQKLSSALQLVDSISTIGENKTAALNSVVNILTDISNLLDSALVPIGSQDARNAVAGLIQGVNKTIISISIQLALQ